MEHVHRNTWKILPRKTASFARTDNCNGNILLILVRNRRKISVRFWYVTMVTFHLLWYVTIVTFRLFWYVTMVMFYMLWFGTPALLSLVVRVDTRRKRKRNSIVLLNLFVSGVIRPHVTSGMTIVMSLPAVSIHKVASGRHSQQIGNKLPTTNCRSVASLPQHRPSITNSVLNRPDFP